LFSKKGEIEMKQKTIAKRVQGIGIGLHKGEPVELTLEPLSGDSGVVFCIKDENIHIKAEPTSVIDTKMATVIGKGGFFISTIEHLLSAVYAYGIDNLKITVDSNEAPIMDGSSASFCMLLDEAGVRELDENKKVMVIKKDVEVKDGEKFVRISPSKRNEYDFTIRFEHPAIKEQKYSFVFSKKRYLEEIAKARTFGFMKDIQYLRANNLALGGSLDNAVVLDEKKILNSEGLRYKDEFVRHKILDAIGDLSLLGHAVMGRYESFAGSHHLNHLLTKEILANEENYEIVELESIKEEEFAKAYA
jgi:UDP-3-O-[3-hydroxymyristoyl] N-acetylglucosamine deacetylase